MKSFFYFLVVFSVFIASCCKDEVAKDISYTDQVPNSVGDYWKYSIKSSTGEFKGFLEVNITKKNTLSDGRTVTTWIYTYPEFTNTVYKILSDTSLEEFIDFPAANRSDHPAMRYMFPLIPGNKWVIHEFADSVKVVSDTTLTVPAGSFDHSFKLNFIASHFIINYWNTSNYWFTPHIGISRMDRWVYNLGVGDFSNGIYELVEYKLK
jgi:hypothetical protein